MSLFEVFGKKCRAEIYLQLYKYKNIFTHGHKGRKEPHKKIHNVPNSARCCALADSLITYTLHEKYSFSDKRCIFVGMRRLISKIPSADYIELLKYNIIS